MPNLLSCLFSILTITTVMAIAPDQSQSQSQIAATAASAPAPSDMLHFEYHKGPLLSGPRSINIYFIWYGAFPAEYKAAIADFFSSFNQSTDGQPTVSRWWKTTETYKDNNGESVSNKVKLGGEFSDLNCSVGKNLSQEQIEYLVKRSIDNKIFPADPRGIYFVLTSSDVKVGGFCGQGICGSRGYTQMSPTQIVLYSHVGDSSTQCPGLCAWPYAVSSTWAKALVAPNGAGIDGMVMFVALNLANTATNPYLNGYYEGSELKPNEAVTICEDVFTEGVTKGDILNSGKLLRDPITNASYDVSGFSGRKFLLPSIFDFSTFTCKVTS